MVELVERMRYRSRMRGGFVVRYGSAHFRSATKIHVDRGRAALSRRVSFCYRTNFSPSSFN